MIAAIWADAPALLRVATYWTPAIVTAPHLTAAPNGATLALGIATLGAVALTLTEEGR